MKIVYSYYTLDIIHRGHLLMLENSEAIAGKDGRLMVGVLSDEVVLKAKGRLPILSLDERIELASSLKPVDLVVVQNTYSPMENIMMIKPDILMESEDHDEDLIQECRNYMESIGGKVIVMPYFIQQCSTNIKANIRKA